MKRLIPITHGSLFSGIGGFDLAAVACGWSNLFYCETDPFCVEVLKFHFPKSYGYGDIKEADFERFRGKVDVLSGGFPCQPYSLAGKRLGKADPRHLWPYMRSAIHTIRPTWVVAENVYGIVTWQEGMVFEEVHAELEAEGYEVGAFILPAAGINAPHRRYRVFFIAHENTGGNGQENNIGQKQPQSRQFRDACTGINERLQEYMEEAWFTSNTCRERCNNRGNYRQERYIQGNRWVTEKDKQERERWKRWTGEACTIVANADECIGCERWLYQKRPKKAREYISTYNARCIWKDWEDFPVEPPVRGRDDGLSKMLDALPFSEEKIIGGRPLTISKWENESLKGFGNAVMPQLAYLIFDSINQIIRDHKVLL